MEFFPGRPYRWSSCLIFNVTPAWVVVPLLSVFLIIFSQKVFSGTETIALTGDSTPDGNGTYLWLGYPSLDILPALNDDGNIAFWSWLTGTSGLDSDDTGVFLGSSTSVIRVAREGQSVPDGNGVYRDFGGPVINNLGQVAFLSLLDGTSGGGADNGGAFRGNGVTVTRIARFGQAAPDANGVFADFESLGLNDTGDVSTWAAFGTTGGGSADNTGVIRGDGVTLTDIVREGDPAPDANGTFSDFISSLDIGLNDFGQTAFRAFLTGASGGAGEGIFRGAGGALTEIVRTGQLAPDTNGQFSEFGNPALNNSGQAAMLAALTGTSGSSADNEGVFRGDGVSLVQIVRKGIAAPDANGVLNAFGSPVINASGQVAFISVLSATSGGQFDSAGVYRGDGISLTQVARAGDAAPDSNGMFYGFAGPTALADGGAVAFWAQLVGTIGSLTGVDDGGIFIADGVDTVQAAREGDVLEGSTILNANFLQGMNSGLNVHGQVAYHASLADGREGVFLFTPELYWRLAGNGAWDGAGNWTLGLVPALPHRVVINPDAGVTVTGPLSDTEIKALQLDAAVSGTSSLVLGSGNLVAGESVEIGGSGILDLNGQAITIGDGVMETTANTARVYADGVLSGSGTLVGNVINSGGTVAPGFSTGTFTINGDYQQEAGGQLEIEIGSVDAYDRLIVTGDVTFSPGATVQITFINGYVPVAGDTFDFLAANAVSGDADVVISISGLPPGFQYSTETDGGILRFVVPDPGLPLGDVTGDGMVNVADLLRAMQILNGTYSPTPEEQARWDVAPLVGGSPQPDTQNTLGDYLVLERIVLGLVSF